MFTAMLVLLSVKVFTLALLWSSKAAHSSSSLAPLALPNSSAPVLSPKLASKEVAAAALGSTLFSNAAKVKSVSLGPAPASAAPAVWKVLVSPAEAGVSAGTPAGGATATAAAGPSNASHSSSSSSAAALVLNTMSCSTEITSCCATLNAASFIAVTSSLVVTGATEEKVKSSVSSIDISFEETTSLNAEAAGTAAGTSSEAVVSTTLEVETGVRTGPSKSSHSSSSSPVSCTTFSTFSTSLDSTWTWASWSG
mmetsp:Transcript_20966/g.36289  ORF Transcript_20966/g.36289 Transcript_20966/m.36289 type:complete len:253 (-) Transcript_20966:2695-3453(-)